MAEASKSGRTSHARYINNIWNALDTTVEEQIDQGYKEVTISVNYIATKIDKSERSVRHHGFCPSGVFEQELDSAEWERQKGLVINLEEYAEERELDLSGE